MIKKSSCRLLGFWCLVIFVIPLSLVSAPNPSLAGHWAGAIELPTMKLEFNVDFTQKEDGSWVGDITIPAQNAKDLPLANVSLKAKEVSFEIPGIPGNPTFKGALSDDGSKITGNFTQSGQAFPFTLNRGASPAAKAKEALAGFDEVVNKGLQSLNVPGAAVAIVKDNDVVFAKGFGFSDVDKKLPITVDTILAIGSASKAFTTFAMGTLIDQGKMDWETPVRNYIAWFRLYDSFASERLTPRDLVTHRSGLPRHDLVWYNNYTASREEFVRRLAHLQPTADLREKFQYNNLMYLTAGYLVEVLTGKKWEDAIRAQVLDPLGMKRTNFSVEDSQKDVDFALPYRERESKIERIPFRNITNVGPAGSINSSVKEMSRWVLVHLNQGKLGDKQIINPQTLQDMHLAHMPTGSTPAIPQVTPADYGLGWMVDTYRGYRRVHHGGNIDGFSAMVSMIPREGIGFVVLANMNGTALPELLIRHAADRLLGLEAIDWLGEAAIRKAKGEEAGKEAQKKKQARRILGTKPAHKPEEYAGDYNHPGYGDLRVALQAGQISFVYNGIATPLEHWHYETFSGKRADDPTFADMKLTFRTDVNGNVAEVEAPFEPTIGEISFSRKPDARLVDPAYLQKFAGKYNLTDQIVTISLKGNSLTLSIPGQPEYDLIPGLGEEFTFKQVKVISVRFKADEKGRVAALEVIQPSGIFEAKRLEK